MSMKTRVLAGISLRPREHGPGGVRGQTPVGQHPAQLATLQQRLGEQVGNGRDARAGFRQDQQQLRLIGHHAAGR